MNKKLEGRRGLSTKHYKSSWVLCKQCFVSTSAQTQSKACNLHNDARSHFLLIYAFINHNNRRHHHRHRIATIVLSSPYLYFPVLHAIRWYFLIHFTACLPASNPSSPQFNSFHSTLSISAKLILSCDNEWHCHVVMSLSISSLPLCWYNHEARLDLILIKFIW